MALYTTVAALVAMALPLASLALYMSASQSVEKASPFECGFEPIKSARSGFSLSFFLLAVLFLIFDVEVALLIPAPLSLNGSELILKAATLILFVMVLILGLLYEWKNGMLVWAE